MFLVSERRGKVGAFSNPLWQCSSRHAFWGQGAVNQSVQLSVLRRRQPLSDISRTFGTARAIWVSCPTLC
eukprot:10806785-Heterocapsa_arctica.AAC.1